MSERFFRGSGFFSDRVSTRRVVLVGAALLAGGLLLSSHVQQVWQLYVTFGLLVARASAPSTSRSRCWPSSGSRAGAAWPARWSRPATGSASSPSRR